MAEEAGQPWSGEIKSGAEMQAEVHAEQQAERAAAREAAYSYREARGAYGTSRHLRAPGGYKTAQHVYTGSNARSYHRHRSQPRRRSRNYGTGGGGTGDVFSSRHKGGGSEYDNPDEGVIAGLIGLFFDFWRRR
jgi:hypothetical protein